MIDDRYEVLDRIGSGAVAVVYLVRHLQLGTLHALKVLLVPTPFVSARLLQEGRLQGWLRHDNVVIVTDSVEVHGAPGLVMQYVRGPSLERLLQHTRLDLPLAKAMGAGILLGVRAAHANGLVHRDLKPANVLVDIGPTSLTPRISDFGLAKSLAGDAGPTATRAGTILGTPAYMAPEQLRDASAVDERADVFSLGAVLYELLTNHRTFPGDDVLEVYDRIRAGRYTPLGSLLADLPPELEAAVDGALRTDPEERIPSVAELLDRWTDGQPQTALAVEWPSEILAIAEGLSPTRPEEAPAPLTAATFDLHLDGAAEPEILGAEPASAPVIVEQTVEEGPTSTLPTPVTPPPALAPRLALRPPPSRPWLPLVGVISVLSLVCLGTIGAVGIGLTADWLQWGPAAPPPPVDAIRRPLYTATQTPRISDRPEVEEAHAEAWLAIRDGRSDDALDALRRITDADRRRDDGALHLLFAAALSLDGDPEAYRRIELAARAAGTRRSAIANLARLAAEGVAGTANPRAIDRHLEDYPDDLLARILLATMAGFDGDRRLDLAQQVAKLDPEHELGWALTADMRIRRGQFASADEAIAQGEEHAPDHPRLVAARALLQLERGDFSEARRTVEGLGPPATAPVDAVRALGGAVRMLRDPSLVEAIEQDLRADDVRHVAFASGCAAAAFGLGDLGDAQRWADLAFERAAGAGRLADAVEIARTIQAMAVLVGRPSDLEHAIHSAEMATAMAGLPSVLHNRLTPRILMLSGLVALERGELAVVQRTITQLESMERGERQAALLRAAALSGEGEEIAEDDDPTTKGCVIRSLGARWRLRAAAPGADPAPLFGPLVAPDTSCGQFGLDRYARADAEVRLAAAAAARGDADAAHAHLSSFVAWMPDVDLDSPLYELYSEAHESLAWLGGD